MDTLLDTHMHIWDPAVLELPWLAGVPELNREFTLAEFRAEAEQLSITNAIYMEVAAAVTSFGAELETVRVTMDSDPFLAGAVVGGRPGSPEFASWLDVLAEDPRIHGVREVLHTAVKPAKRCLEENFIAGIQLLGERGYTFDACMRAGELQDIARLANACPDTTIVLDHFGNPPVEEGPSDAWRQALEDVASQGNTIGKMSGLIQNCAGSAWTVDDFAPFVDALLESFGPDRVVWASNWPVCTLRGSLARWVAATHEVLSGISSLSKAAILHGNARRIYGLS